MPLSLSGTLKVILYTWIVGSSGYRLYKWRKQAPGRQIDRLLVDACAASGKEGEALLAGLCEVCASQIREEPQNSHLLHVWAVALWWRASKASGAEADRLLEQADEKFSRAQTISPNDGAIRADRASAMQHRAALHPDEKGRRLLIQVCDQCEKRVGIYAGGQQDARMFHTWGAALWWLATREKGAEAQRLYEQADEKFTRGLALASDQTDMAVDQVSALVWRSALHTGQEQREILMGACKKCEQLGARGAGGVRMLSIWGYALCCLGAIAKGPEAERFYAEAENKTSRALAIDAGSVQAAIMRVRALSGQAFLQQANRAAIF